MRETRSSGSVEGVMSNRDPYSDSIDNLEFVVRGKAKSNTSIPAAMATSRFPAKV
jgi:hypothetical protein